MNGYLLLLPAKEGTTGSFLLDNKTIVRVRYLPPTKSPGTWQGLQEDGQVVKLQEDALIDQFGKQFMNECKALGQKKYVQVQ